MNPLLTLRGNFSHSRASGVPGTPELPPDQIVKTEDVTAIRKSLDYILNTWDGINSNPIVSVYYEKTIPKSRRFKRLFSWDKQGPDSYIVGAKFWGEKKDKHQIVYCVPKDCIRQYIDELTVCSKLLDRHFSGEMSSVKLKEINSKGNRDFYSEIIESYGLKRTPFTQLIVDIALVHRIGIDNEVKQYSEAVFVTLYKSDISASKVLELLQIPHSHSKVYDDQTLMLDKNEYARLSQEAPYLISMSCSNEVTCDDLHDDEVYGDVQVTANKHRRTIGSPTTEPTIGVIDTLFLDDPSRVYFSEWVTFNDMTSDDEPCDDDTFLHGTCVDSIIVDGPALNPDLDDGCGRFKVRHFGITRSRTIHLFEMAKCIRSIISSNRDISVWNLSLGDKNPIPEYSISPLASILDELQNEYKNIIFVVSGTNNDEKNESGNTDTLPMIGSPADSINSVVVNSVRSNKEPATYTRIGPVLRFFTKPDLAYYGGDVYEPCNTWGIYGESRQKGTSFAAPWIARKLSYLIDIKGFSREVAKALLIDAASGWNPDLAHVGAEGHGVPPVRIEDVIGCRDDEIRFVITGKTELYQTYNYRIPIPIEKGKFPYTARATLCYFPRCSRAQGVDYTDTELDFRFGRLRSGKVLPINNDLQNDLKIGIKECDARKNFRKWDNVKIISEKIKDRKVPKKTYETPLWGIDITSKKRLDNKEREDIPFGIVVTLKEMNRKNRIDAFVRACQANGWLVESVVPEVDVDFLASLNEDLELESESDVDF